ncbi:MAG: zf-TFIIB domain-containing protein [Vulcanimicrobiota bacterium]
MKNLTCPKCLQGMDVFHQLGVEIDQCNNCGGVWLDRDEWKALTRSRGADAVQLEVIHLKPTEFKCPRCGEQLKEGHHAEYTDFIIEHCARCGGGFFDRGEMSRLLAR